jgi:hypothetical protein
VITQWSRARAPEPQTESGSVTINAVKTCNSGGQTIVALKAWVLDSEARTFRAQGLKTGLAGPGPGHGRQVTRAASPGLPQPRRRPGPDRVRAAAGPPSGGHCCHGHGGCQCPRAGLGSVDSDPARGRRRDKLETSCQCHGATPSSGCYPSHARASAAAPESFQASNSSLAPRPPPAAPPSAESLSAGPGSGCESESLDDDAAGQGIMTRIQDGRVHPALDRRKTRAARAGPGDGDSGLLMSESLTR